MMTAKLFRNGRSQAVRLPKECRFSKREREVYVHKFEEVVLLISKRSPWASLRYSLDKFTNDFMNKRNQPSQEDSRAQFS